MSECNGYHRCNCGTGEPTPHNVGTGGCVRFLTDAPVKNGDMWIVDDAIVTDYTLRWQRGYFQHDDGCWSRWEGSVNSLPDET